MRVCPYCGYYNPDSFTRCSDCKQPLITYGNRSAFRQWRVCPDCGYNNVEEAETCLRCGCLLVEPVDMPELQDEPELAASVGFAPLAPLPFSRVDTAIRVGRAMLLFVLGVGLCPAILVAVSVLNPPGSANGGIIPLLALSVLFLAVILLISKQTRPIGYGLLAAAFMFPIVIAIACGVRA